MAISPKMLALIQKIEAADAERFARLRKSADPVFMRGRMAAVVRFA